MSNAPAPIILVENVTKVFDGGNVRALDGLSLGIDRGEFVAVTGPSGCGKSTLLNLVAALDAPTSGQITVNGRNLRAPGNDRYRRMEVGMVFQLHNLLPRLSALENVEIPMFANGMSYRAQRQRAQDMLEAVGLAEKGRAVPPRLSGGERQRLAVARALANNPPILLADEPTGSLDTVAVERLLELFRSVRDAHGVTIMLVTHDPAVARVADRIVHMRDGRVVKRGTSARG